MFDRGPTATDLGAVLDSGPRYEKILYFSKK